MNLRKKSAPRQSSKKKKKQARTELVTRNYSYPETRAEITICLETKLNFQFT